MKRRNGDQNEASTIGSVIFFMKVGSPTQAEGSPNT